MKYQSSIRAVNTAQAHYFHACKLGDDNRIGKALEILWRIKAEHKAEYGALTRVEGEWV